MPSFQIDVNQVAQTVLGPEEDVSVSELMFGGISSQWIRHSGFEESSDHLSMSFIRFPGGYPAEGLYYTPDGSPSYEADGNEYIYDLSYENLILPSALENDQRMGLRETLELAIERGQEVAIIIPTRRYFDEPEDVFYDVVNLLDRLYIEGDFGTNIPKITFDVGNEVYDSPEDYGRVSAEAVRALSEFRSDVPNANFDIGLQTMRVGTDTLEMVDAFNAQAGDNTLLAEIDAVRHHALQLSHDEGARLEHNSLRYWAMKRLQDAVVEAGRDPEDLDLYFSAWTGEAGAESGAQSNQPFALAGASSTLSAFTSMLELGADRAAIWGADVSDVHSTVLGYNPSRGYVDEIQYSPMGETFRLMAESLPGMSLVDDGNLDARRGETDAFTYTFVDESKAVVFIAADEFDGDTLDVDVNLSNFGNISFAWAERVTVSGSSLTGRAVATRENLDWENASFSVTLNKPNEVIRIIAVRENPGDNPVETWGTMDDDVMRGGGGNDLLEGRGGDDTLIGGNGVNLLIGGEGNDHYRTSSRLDRVVEVDGEGEADRVSAARSFSLEADARVEILSTNGAVGTADIDLWGNGFAQTITGNAGDNLLADGGGDHADVLWGMGGDDHYILRNAGSVVTEIVGAGARDRISTSSDFALRSNQEIELLTTTSSLGIAAIDLTGNHMDQRIYGNRGDNRLEGGGGFDVLFGGQGADTFVFSADPASENFTTLQDFETGVDRIELEAAVFDAIGIGVLDDDAFHRSASGQAGDGQDRIIFDTSSGYLYYDSDGSGSAGRAYIGKVGVNTTLEADDIWTI